MLLIVPRKVSGALYRVWTVPVENRLIGRMPGFLNKTKKKVTKYLQKKCTIQFKPMLWIRMFFGPSRSGSANICTDLDPDPSSSSKNTNVLFSTVLWLLNDFLSLQNVPSTSNKQKTLEKNNFLLASWRSQRKKAGSETGSASQLYGSADPDPYQTVTDPPMKPCQIRQVAQSKKVADQCPVSHFLPYNIFYKT